MSLLCFKDSTVRGKKRTSGLSATKSRKVEWGEAVVREENRKREGKEKVN